ncbi:acyltransferase family protein [Hydrogenophaga sp. MI9]|uniref:acyltransferase family protein n=1 Tax=Hydrogenophaga sp. MI9 TaxID=3453719 RepID=UPI003EEEF874
MSSPLHDSSHSGTHQAHIDGLRAIAVLAVIANHFDHSLLPGGFLGVDIFFVISGFVITASLVSRPREPLGPFLLAFFQRRIKRLAPALLVCVLATAVAICVLNPTPQSSLMTGISALFGVANIYLYQQSLDYFAQAAQSNVFTHTWSLGVEEQFYFVYPALFWVTTGGRLARSKKTLALVICTLGVASYLAFHKTFATSPSFTYFFSPLRFWELALGCLLCVGRESRVVLGLRRLMAWLGPLPLVALLACLWIPESRLVQGTTTAVVLTGLLLVAPGGLGLSALTAPPLRHVGLISYSLYLWHWPVLVLARWSVGITPSSGLWLLLAMVALAEASYQCVESPLRRRPWRFPISVGLGASAICAAALLMLSQVNDHLLWPVNSEIDNPPAFLPVKDQNYNPGCVVNDHNLPLGSGTFDLCTVPPRAPAHQTLWTMGDSHAGHLQGMLYQLHEDTGLGVHLIETPGQPYPYIAAVFEPRERILETTLARARPGDTFVVSRLYFYRGSLDVVTDLQTWADQLLTLAKKLEQRQMYLLVIGPPPIFNFEHSVVCLRTAFSNRACEQDRARLKERVDQVAGTLEKTLASQHNALVFRPFDVLCSPGAATCSPLRKNTMLFRDRDHLNTAGSAALAQPLEKLLRDRGILAR